MSDSSDLDDAFIQLLLNDAQLKTLCPDGVWFDVSKEGTTRFVIVSLIDTEDVPMFHDGTNDGRAWESMRYLVKAVGLKSVGPDMKGAAARIDALMAAAGQTLTLPSVTVNGYKLMLVERVERIRISEPDTVNKADRWFHRGGHYEVWAHAV